MIQLIKFPRQMPGSGRVLFQQEIKRQPDITHPAGRVQPGSQGKGNITGRQALVTSPQPVNRPQAVRRGSFKSGQPFPDDDPVDADKRHDIGNRADRGKYEQAGPAIRDPAPHLVKRQSQHQGHPRARKLGEWIGFPGKHGVDQRRSRLFKSLCRQVVISHDDIHAPVHQIPDQVR